MDLLSLADLLYLSAPMYHVEGLPQDFHRERGFAQDEFSTANESMYLRGLVVYEGDREYTCALFEQLEFDSPFGTFKLSKHHTLSHVEFAYDVEEGFARHLARDTCVVDREGSVSDKLIDGLREDASRMLEFGVEFIENRLMLANLSYQDLSPAMIYLFTGGDVQTTKPYLEKKRNERAAAMRRSGLHAVGKNERR